MRRVVNYWRQPISIWALSILMLFPLLSLAAGPGAQEDKLVGHWTFEKGSELKDLMGNFADIKLNGAKIKDGKLDVDSGKWAIATPYKGPDILDKTLVSWASIDSLKVQKGSILTIDRLSDPTFDAIVLGERQNQRWMAGSGWFHRTQDPKPGFEETKENRMAQLAISYKKIGGGEGTAHVVIYHNGVKIGDYKQGIFPLFAKDDCEAIWGIRHGGVGGGPGNMDAKIEDARIYATVLSQGEVKALRPDTLAIEALAKLATTWAAIKAR